jgi:hypothetical protein
MKNLEKLPKVIKINDYSYHLRTDHFNDITNIGYWNQHGPAHGLTIQIKAGESIDDAVAILQDKLKNLC